jgi:hypothetical protein
MENKTVKNKNLETLMYSAGGIVALALVLIAGGLAYLLVRWVQLRRSPEVDPEPEVDTEPEIAN